MRTEIILRRLSLATGSLMALTMGILSLCVLYFTGMHLGWINRELLIVLAVVCFVSTGCELILLIRSWWQLLVPNVLLVTGATVYMVNFLDRALGNNVHLRDEKLLIIHFVMLVLVIFVSGVVIGTVLITNIRKEVVGKTGGDLERDQHHLKIVGEAEEKILGMKFSSLTLTPELDLLQQMQEKNWMNECVTITYGKGELGSTPSMSKDAMALTRPGVDRRVSSASNASIRSCKRSAAVTAPVVKNRVINRLQNRLSSMWVSKKTAPHVPKGKDIEARYVTRLSMIPNTPKTTAAQSIKSFDFTDSVCSHSIPVSIAKGEMRSDESCLNTSNISQQKNEEDRYSDLLILPGMRPDDSSSYEMIDAEATTNLEDIHQDLHLSEKQEPVKQLRVTTNINLDNWNGVQGPYTEAGNSMHENKTGDYALDLSYQNPPVKPKGLSSPALKFCKFSFPNNSTVNSTASIKSLEIDTDPMELPSFTEDGTVVAILDKALYNTQHENDVIMQCLQQSSSALDYGLGVDMNQRHSPSKSNYSTYSSKSRRKSAIHCNCNTSHSRSNSVYSVYNPSSVMQRASNQSSPIKSIKPPKLVRNLSHKLSKSVLNPKRDGKDTTDSAIETPDRLVDFSYVQHLQHKHSPSRSINTFCNFHRRGSSTVQYPELSTLSGLQTTETNNELYRETAHA
ncbi:HBR372Wp [Eremothecium sinecaudum]|uniref:HBR372Wp n=1 Tax=Eremothecium sinecaudum TaxID=45286 RepID=A0A109UXD3_9SACH|nr:HBR372Wp [Eremothecium sinecaudum]AMD19273.1 HBR372Wp [Eremothecium sinecaudum]